MFSPRPPTRSVVVPDGLDGAESDHGWDALLRDLATEPGLDPQPSRLERAVTIDLPASGSRPFGGFLDLLLLAAAVITVVVVAAVGVAVMQAT